MSQTVKVSDVIAEILEEKGIKHVFGIIGSGNAHIFDSITKRGFTEIVCVHHEQAAIMAMMIYFRTTGKMSATLLTTGAGSANGVTGIVSAWMDSIPGVIISGNENSRFTTQENPLRIWGIQGYDSVAMVAKVTKYGHRLMDPRHVRVEMEKSFQIAREGRPGPVWLDVPMNIQAAPVAVSEIEKFDGQTPGTKPITAPGAVTNPKKAAAEMIAKLRTAKRPVIWLGNGIRLADAAQLVKPLVEKLGIPTLVSWAGIDMIDSDHPLVYGRAGIYGQRSANFVLQNSDFVLTIGTRLAVPQVGYDLTEFARAAEVACVDIEPQEVVKHGARVKYPYCMDAGKFMTELLSAAKTETLAYPEWVKQCDLYREKFPWVGPEHADQGGFINSYRFMERLVPHFKKDQIAVTDMGTALLSGHQVLKFKDGQRFMTSTGLGEMGFGLPAAIGASIARDRGEVMCLNCDGGMMMNLQELQTIAHHKLPIKVIIFNNDGYLMIKHTQKALFQGRYSGTDKKSGVTCPDYAKVAKAFDFPCYAIRTWEDFDTVMPKVQAETGPVFCEVFMHPEQFFYPKLGLSPQKDGSIISPPLEDLSPFIARDVLREAMIVGMHPKSEKIEVAPTANSQTKR